MRFLNMAGSALDAQQKTSEHSALPFTSTSMLPRSSMRNAMLLSKLFSKALEMWHRELMVSTSFTTSLDCIVPLACTIIILETKTEL